MYLSTPNIEYKLYKKERYDMSMVSKSQVIDGCASNFNSDTNRRGVHGVQLTIIREHYESLYVAFIYFSALYCVYECFHSLLFVYITVFLFFIFAILVNIKIKNTN